MTIPVTLHGQCEECPSNDVPLYQSLEWDANSATICADCMREES